MGSFLAFGSDDRTVKVWSVGDDYTLVKKIICHTNGVHLVDYSPDRKKIAPGLSNNTICIWGIALSVSY